MTSVYTRYLANALHAVKWTALCAALIAWWGCSAPPPHPVSKPTPTQTASIGPSSTAVSIAPVPSAEAPALPPIISRVELLTRFDERPTYDDYHCVPRQPIAVAADGQYAVLDGGQVKVFAADGTAKWTAPFEKTATAANHDVVLQSVAFTEASVFVFGHHSTGFKIGSQTVPSVAYVYQTFVVRLDRNGATQWVAALQGGADQATSAFAVGPRNETFVLTPVYADSPHLRAGAISKNHEFFLRKIDARGTVSWVKKVAEGSSEMVAGLAVNASGDVLASYAAMRDGNGGHTLAWFPAAGTANVRAEVQAGQVLLDAAGRPFHVFETLSGWGITAYEKTLAKRWEKRFAVRCPLAALAPDGGVVLAGKFSGTMLFDSVSVETTDPNGAPFIVAFSGTGEALWARAFNGRAAEVGPFQSRFGVRGMAFLPDGTLLVEGYFDEELLATVVPGWKQGAWAHAILRITPPNSK